MTTRRSRAADTQRIAADEVVIRALHITVNGQPKPKGSMRHIGKGRMVEQLEGSAPWRQTVAYAARQIAERMDWEFGTTIAVGVGISLNLPRPKSAPKKRTWPITRSSGDIDKHLRNISDALVDAGIIADDSQIVIVKISKHYVTDGQTPGALIHIWELT